MSIFAKASNIIFLVIKGAFIHLMLTFELIQMDILLS